MPRQPQTNDAQAWEEFMTRMQHLNLLELLAWSDIPYSNIFSRHTYNLHFLPQLQPRGRRVIRPERLT